MEEDTRSKLNGMIGLFQEGSINWLQLAPFLSQADQEGLDLSEFKLLKEYRIQIIRAYRFLQVQRPDYITNSGQKPVRAKAISYLPVIYKRMPPETREKEFDNLVDGVLTGKVGVKKLVLISKGLLGKSVANIPIKKIIPEPERKELSEEILEAFSGGLSLLEYVTDEAIKKKGYVELRRLFGNKCHRISARLNCIADEEFLKLWKERREVSL